MIVTTSVLPEVMLYLVLGSIAVCSRRVSKIALPSPSGRVGLRDCPLLAEDS